MEIKIELVKIKLGKKEIELSIEDAKKLQAILNDTFIYTHSILIELNLIIIYFFIEITSFC